MQSAGIKKIGGIFAVALLVFGPTLGWTQDNLGSADLDQAFDLKIKAQSTRDLDAVVKLCKSAIEKGLDEEAKIQAQQLAAASLFEHADQLAQRIFAEGGQDARWQKYRSEALARLGKAVEYQPDLATAHLMIARLNLLPGGDREAAKAAVEKVVQVGGEDREQLSNALFMRASLTEDKDAQLSDLNQSIKINPKNMDPVRVRALYYLSVDETDKALEDINQLLQSENVKTQNYIETVVLLMTLGPKFDEKLQGEAIRILDRAIERDADDVRLFELRSRINILREKLDEAVVDITKAIETDRRINPKPGNIGLLTERAAIYLEQEKLDEALADVTEALAVEPMLARGVMLRGLILMQQEDFSAAIDDIKLLAESDPENQSLQRQLAMLYNAAEEPTKAIEIYDELIKNNSEEKFAKESTELQFAAMAERSASLRGRGDARLSTGEHPGAVADFEEALKLSEELRQIQEQENKSDEPIPVDDGILNNLAWVLATSPDAEVRNGERAVKLATEAAEATKFKQAHILSTLASGYAETGDFENAKKWIEKAIEVNRQEREKAPTKRNSEQQLSLQKEFDSYKKSEPWRELQSVEKDKATNPEGKDEAGDDKPEPAEKEKKAEDDKKDSGEKPDSDKKGTSNDDNPKKSDEQPNKDGKSNQDGKSDKDSIKS